MEQVCPICNGLNNHRAICQVCGSPMDERGSMEDYAGPYSPYMDDESFACNNSNMVIGDHQCIHLYVCSNCGTIRYRAVSPNFF